MAPSSGHPTHNGHRSAWYRALVEHTQGLLVVTDRDLTLVFANPAGLRALGYPPERYLGRPIAELFHPDDLGTLHRQIDDLLRAPESTVASTFRMRDASGEWRSFEASATSVPDGADGPNIVVAARDVTDQLHLRRALETLAAGNRVLLHASHEQQLLNDMCETIVQTAGYLLAWVGYADENGMVPVVAAAGATGYVAELKISCRDDDLGRGPTGTAMRTGVAQVLDDMRAAAHFAPWRERAERFGFRTSCVFPLRDESGVFGALTIYAGEPGAFDVAARELLSQLAGDLGYGIGRLRDAKRLRESFRGTITALGAVAELRDPYNAGHQRRVAVLSRAIAESLGLDPEEVAGIEVAALVHDIGKLAVPAEILSCPAVLSTQQFALVKEHVRAGYEILRTVEFPWPVADLVVHHHERLDGSGYPDGLVGDEISVGGRIIGVADVVEAMSSHRPHRPALGIPAAIEEIRAGAGTRYDERVVDACVDIVRREGYRFGDPPLPAR